MLEQGSSIDAAVIAALISVLVSIALGPLINHLPTLLGFLYGSALPVSGWFLLRGHGGERLVGLVLIVGVIIIHQNAKVFHRMLRESIKLQLERTLVAERFEEALREAEVANEVKTRFMASLSHGLRTPLQGIQGGLDLILDSGSEEERRVVAEGSLGAARHLRMMLDDLLDFSRLEMGELSVDAQALDLVPLLESIIGSFRHEADQRGLDLNLRLPTARVGVRADPTRLR